LKDGGKDNMTKEENKIIIRVKYTFGNKENEITFEHEKIKMSCEEEAEFVKESIKLLTEEKVNLKKEVHLLNQFIEEKKPIQKKKKRIKKTEKN
jgi:thymidylate synthase